MLDPMTERQLINWTTQIDPPPPPANWKVNTEYSGYWTQLTAATLSCTIEDCPEPDLRAVEFDPEAPGSVHKHVHKHNFRYHPELVPVYTAAGWAIGVLSGSS